MKQYLTKDQLTECPMSVRTKLVEFCVKNNIKTWKMSDIGKMEGNEPDEYNLPLLNVGQLIQFLTGKIYMEITHIGKNIHWYVLDKVTNCQYDSSSDELIDALWEAVKRLRLEEVEKDGK